MAFCVLTVARQLTFSGHRLAFGIALRLSAISKYRVGTLLALSIVSPMAYLEFTGLTKEVENANDIGSYSGACAHDGQRQ